MDIYEDRDIKSELRNDIIDPKEIKTETEVQKYYNGKTVLITGATGFLGMLLIEKLLRSCPNIKKLILIVREKKGKSVAIRTKEIFSEVIFEKIKLQKPDYWKKIHIVTGCCEEFGFGLNDTDVKIIQEEVNIVFHLAATLRYDDPLRKAYTINVQGTKALLEIAKNIKHLKAFVYVSTLYSQCYLTEIDESIYDPAISDDELEYLLNNLNDLEIATFAPIILNGRPNSYTMTKGLAESVVAGHRSELPVMIYRPAIVSSTQEEPLVGWTNNLYGMVGVFAGAVLGFLRILLCDPQVKADLIPADRVVNGMIVLPKHAEKKWYTMSSNNREATEPVYNVVSDQNNSITWQDGITLSVKVGEIRNSIPRQSIWVPHLSLEKYYYVWLTKFYIIHLLPALIYVLIEKLLKQEPRIWKGYRKLYYYNKLISFFTTRSLKIADSNADDLYNSLSATDQILFNCNKKCDWPQHFYYIGHGLARYLFKWDINIIAPSVIIQQKVMVVLDRLIVWSAKGIFYYLVYRTSLYVLSSILPTILFSKLFKLVL